MSPTSSAAEASANELLQRLAAVTRKRGGCYIRLCGGHRELSRAGFLHARRRSSTPTPSRSTPPMTTTSMRWRTPDRERLRERHESLFRRRAASPRPEILPLVRRAETQSRGAGARRAIACRREGGGLHRSSDLASYGLGPMAAIHTPEYIEFLQRIYERWQRIEGASAEVIPNIHPIARGGSRPDSAVGQAGYHMADTSLPDLGTYVRELVLERLDCGRRGGGRRGRRVVRLCALPAAGPSRLRRRRRRLLLLQQFWHRRPAPAQDRRPSRHPRRRPPPRQRHAGRLLPARRRAAPSRSMRTRCASIPSSGVMPTSAAKARASATTSICRWPGSRATKSSSKRLPPASAASRPFAPDALVVALGLDAFEGDPFGGLSVSTPGFRAHRRSHRRPLAAYGDRAGRRLSLRRAGRQSDLFSDRIRQPPQSLAIGSLLADTGPGGAVWCRLVRPASTEGMRPPVWKRWESQDGRNRGKHPGSKASL